MKILIITSLAIGLFVLAGCGASEPEKKEKADSIEDIVGIWRRTGGANVDYVQYIEDGTFIGCASDLESLEVSSVCRGEFWFEDAQYFEKYDPNSSGGEGCPPSNGVYEINLQPNGNLKFAKVEDKCPGRASWRQGRISFGEDNVEWELVP